MNPTSLTNERLCALAQKGDEAARELLVEKNMGFIVQTADIVYRSSSLEGSDLNIDVDDLVQEGSIGLLRAVDGSDPARKLRFLTYAAPAIKNAMLDLVHTAQMSFEYRMVTAKVQDGVEGLGLERVHLDEILPGDERLLRIEAIADPYALSPEETFIKVETLWELYAALDKLEPREQTYLLYRFGFTDTPDTALIQVLRHLESVVIVDESHNAESKLSTEMLNNLNPSFVLDLTATPRKNSNIISYVDARELKKESLKHCNLSTHSKKGARNQAVIKAAK